MRMWVIPMVYVGAAVTAGLSLPRLEQAYLASDTLLLSVGSAQAYLSAAASGMMALTGIVFAMGFVMVQFSAIAYSPRLVLWYARDPILFHALGVFSATFIYALFTLAWVDREGAGRTPLRIGVSRGATRSRPARSRDSRRSRERASLWHDSHRQGATMMAGAAVVIATR